MLGAIDIVVASHRATKRWPYAEDVEERAGHQRGLHETRGTVFHHHGTHDTVARHAGGVGEEPAGVSHGLDFSTAKRVLDGARGPQLLPGDNQAVLVEH